MSSHYRTAMQKIVPALVISALLTTPAFAAPTPAKSKPPVLTCKTTNPEGLSYTVLKAGKGERPGADAKVKVNYKGMLKSDGTQFDAGDGVEFKVGGVIPGFGQGLQLMQPGGKMRLCIPSKLGYGEAGTGPIPANADLVFEVDLLSFTTPPPKPVIPVAERICDKVTASGLGYLAIRSGNGKIPTDTDMALVDFTPFDAKTGVTLDKREWETIVVSQANIIFAEAIKAMQMGSSYTFCPPKTAETAGQPDVNVRIDLIDIRPAPVPD